MQERRVPRKIQSIPKICSQIFGSVIGMGVGMLPPGVGVAGELGWIVSTSVLEVGMGVSDPLKTRWLEGEGGM